MKILIADDEKLVCFTLESMLNELGVHSNSIVKCFNGEDFLKRLSEHLPDIAFVDIKMPRVNGIDAIERGKALSPKTKYYILTSFPEFDYAKRAIDIGVAGYLLKPISLDELKGILSSFKAEEQEYYRRVNAYFENLINALFNNTISVKDEGVRDIRSLNFLGVIVVIDSPSPEDERSEYQVAFFNNLRKDFKSFVSVGINYAISTLENGYPVVVLGWDPSKVRQHLGSGIVEHVRRKLLAGSSENVRSVPSFIFTEVSLSYEEFVEKLDYLKDKTYVRSVLGIGDGISEGEVAEVLENGEINRLALRASNLIDAYSERDYLSFLKITDELSGMLSRLSEGDETQRTLSSLCRFFEVNLDLKIQPLRLIDALREAGSSLIEKQMEESTDSAVIVEQVKRFVEKNYMNNIGIAEIAYKLNLTPNYLSALFHRKTGKTFINYLTEIRIERAKEFLADPSMKVCDVAERVGYYSTRYFSKVFKRKVGFQPSEYIKLLVKNPPAKK